MTASKVTVYSWKDTGAPMPETVTSSPYYGAQYLMQILKACLVDGYGEKDSAGWTLENYDDTLGQARIALSNGNGIFEAVTQGAYGTSFILHESVITYGVGLGSNDTATWTDGVNSRSDYDSDYSRDTENQILGTVTRYLSSYLNASDDTSNNGWYLIATDKTMIFYCVENPDYYHTTPTAPPLSMSVYAGAYFDSVMNRNTLGNMCCISSNYSAKTTFASNQYYWDSYPIFLKNPFGDDVLSTEKMRILYVARSANSDNPYSPLMPHISAFLYYTGDANPDENDEEYLFGALSGLREMLGTYTDTLCEYDQYILGNEDRIKADPVHFQGFDCYPVRLYGGSNYLGWFISTDPQYWV